MKKYFGKNEAALLLPETSTQDNKYSRGRVLLFAGSEQYKGAGLLAARGALRMGCGYVVLAQNKQFFSEGDPDLIYMNLKKQDWKAQNWDAILVGPGFGVNEATRDLIVDLKTSGIKSVVLDADAISVCSKYYLFPIPESWVLTPHAGELSRSMGKISKTLSSQREALIDHGHQLTGGILLLKGFETLVTDGNDVFQIKSGNEALAKAGTGDVLAGMITALRGSGLSPLHSALLGAYIHGATANLWKARHLDLLSMRSIDVVDLIPRVIGHLRSLGVKQIAK